MKTTGEIAYQAYCKYSKGKSLVSGDALPAGVQAVFAPNPAWAITTVTFSALPTAPVSSTPLQTTITATPTTIAAGQSPHSIPLGVLVKHRYTVTPDVAKD